MNILCNFCSQHKAELRSGKYQICLQLTCHRKLIDKMEKDGGK